MASLAQLREYSAGRKAFAQYLLEHGINGRELARRVGIKESHLSLALSTQKPTFFVFRTRLRIEHGTGMEIWTDRVEAAQFAEIGRRLRVDLREDKLSRIRDAAFRAGLRNLPWSGTSATERPSIGFAIFRELLRHYFPESTTHHASHYKPIPTSR